MTRPAPLQSDELRRLIAGGETLTVEFKRDANDDDIVEAAVCLANGHGGVVLVGVADNGTVVGAKPRHGATTDVYRVQAMIGNRTRPSLAVEATVVDIGGAQVLALDVPRSQALVATLQGRYLRRALRVDGTPECVPIFVHETSSHGLQHDPSLAIVANARWADLDRVEIARARRLIRESGGRGDLSLVDLSDEDLCRALGCVDDDGTTIRIRRSGLLLFGHEDALRRLLPTHEVAWQALRADDVLENDFYRLPLLRTFDLLTDRFRARNRAVELVDLFRTEVPDFSEDAFREALANALTHRDYSLLGAVHVQWTDEGIEIGNPGGLPEGVTPSNLLVTQPRPRNLALADAFKRMGVVERSGRGVDRIYDGQVRYGRALPRYEATPNSVRVTLPGGAANLDLVRWIVTEGRAGRNWSVFDLLVLRACADLGSLKAEDAAAAMQTDVERARATLTRLVGGGVLDARGDGRGRVYHLSSAMYRLLGDRAGYVRVRGFEPAQQEQMILQYVRQHGAITRGEAAELCRIAPRAATEVLRRLVAAGVGLHMEGSRRSARYVWRAPDAGGAT